METTWLYPHYWKTISLAFKPRSAAITQSMGFRNLLSASLLFNLVTRRAREGVAGRLLGMSSTRVVRISHLRKKLPTVSAIFKVVLHLFWRDASLIHHSSTQELRPLSLPVHPYQCLFVFDGFVSHPKYNICHVLWYKPPYASVRCCGSSSVYKGQTRLLCVCGDGPDSANGTSRAGP